MPVKEVGIRIAEHACDISKREVSKVVPRNVTVLHQFPRLRKDFSLIRDIPVTDIRTEECVQTDAERKAVLA